jgi:hypothetical protein
MSKSQSNKSENNIGLIASGLIGLGCLTALGAGLITLPVAIGVGLVVVGGFGAKELMNIREEEEKINPVQTIDPFQAKYEKAIQDGFIEINLGRRPLNETQIEEKKATEEGKRIGEEIAREHLSDPTTTTENSLVIKKYQDLYDEEKRKDADSKEAKDAKFKFRVASVAKEIAIDFTKKPQISTDILKAYKQDKEFKKEVVSFQTLRENAIAKSAFDEVAKVIVKHQQKPSSNLGSPRVNQRSRGEEK